MSVQHIFSVVFLMVPIFQSKLFKWLGVFFVMACGGCQTPELQLAEVEFSIVKNLPSGSGITKVGDQFFAIGDDAPFLFGLNKDFQIVNQLVLMDTVGFKGGKIPKKIKPDFEALEFIEDLGVLVLGSGSKSPQRDQILLVQPNVAQSIEVLDGQRFFSYLRNHPDLQAAPLNIEAVAIQDSILWVGNRGKNVFFGWNVSALVHALRTGQPIPEARTIAVDLPSIQGIEAGLSGAVAVPHQNKIIFTASVEGTDDTYNDGEILGSFVGVLNLTTSQIQTMRLPEDKGVLKIESITFGAAPQASQAQIVMISDDDQSLDSWIVKAALHW